VTAQNPEVADIEGEGDEETATKSREQPVEEHVSRGLLDTSVFIARESGRALQKELLPDESAISAVTVGELRAGVLAATDTGARARRLATLDAIADIEVLAVDEAVAASWASLRVHLAESGRRLNVNDLWIAATALTHQIPVVTQDDDFEPVAGVGGLLVVRV
jgi:predicted nucleic acid-binding protein